MDIQINCLIRQHGNKSAAFRTQAMSVLDLLLLQQIVLATDLHRPRLGLVGAGLLPAQCLDYYKLLQPAKPLWSVYSLIAWPFAVSVDTQVSFFFHTAHVLFWIRDGKPKLN